MEGVSTVVATKISSAEAKLIDAIKDYLSEKGEDINRDVLIDTPERFIKQSLKITHIHGDFLMVKNFSSWCNIHKYV
jgi:GTP cyclohydrolase I